MVLVKSIIALYFILLGLAPLHAQKLKHEAKSYQTEEGILYWNKSTPVYLRIANSPGDKGILLQNSDQESYSNPIYFDTEGVNYIRTKDAVDNKTLKLAQPIQEVILPVYADGQSPVSKCNFLNAENYRKGDTQYFGKGLSLELLGADAISGVEGIYYAINNQPYIRYQDEIPLNTSGKNVLKYYAVDHVGNVEQENETHLIIDSEAPNSSYAVEGPQIDNSFTLGTKFFIASIDSLSGIKSIYYRFDEASYQSYRNQGINIDALSDGYHTLAFYAIDHVLNQEEVKTYEFFFDKSAPLIAADILGDRFIVDDQIYFSGRTKLKLTAVDNRVGVKDVKYSVNNQEYQDYIQPFYLPNTTGDHIIRYYAVDNFGNKTNDDRTSSDFHEYEHSATKVYVDLTGPNLAYDFEGELLATRDTVFVNSSTKVIFKANDKESGLQKITYSLEGSAEEFDYTSPISFDKEGYHSIDFYGYDNVNNRNASHMNMYVDNIGPKTFYYFSSEPHENLQDTIDTYSPNVNVYLAATDDHVGLRSIYYKINGGKELVYSSKIKEFKRNKNYSIEIRAVDNLGNEARTKVEFSTAKK